MAHNIDRLAGSLIGQCLGDALGFVVEGHSREICGDYAKLLRSGEVGSIGRASYPFGQYTDDSQLARELVQSFVQVGRFDAEDYARRIAAIFVEGRIVGRGRATEEAAFRIADGVPWHRAGTPPPAAGNGGAMRAAPIGWMHDDNEALLRDACDQARITHQDRRSQAGAVVIAKSVSVALRSARVDRVSMVAELAAAAERVDHSVASAVRSLPDWLSLDEEEAQPLIAVAGVSSAAEHAHLWPGVISPFVIPSVLWSLYSFLRTPDDYWETICTAIAGGGDTDTTAAMAGAISGSYLGFGALPRHLVIRLNDRGSWGADDLVRLAGEAATILGRVVI
jgi:ADP-ribosylglycohydrolase